NEQVPNKVYARLKGVIYVISRYVYNGPTTLTGYKASMIFLLPTTLVPNPGEIISSNIASFLLLYASI
ncbi:MAG: hypothetical protein WB612_01330, partial [Nitrososphaeraceae archaeon]